MFRERQPRTVNPGGKQVSVPDLERKYGLLYLVNQLGGLNRGQVKDLADVIDADNQQNRVRSLAEVAGAAQLVDPGHRRFFRYDAFLNHVALSYTPASLHQVLSHEPIAPDEQPRSLADHLAGDGPARPLLKGLYALEGLGLVIVRTGEDSSELFVPTTRGRAYANTLGDIFDHIVNWDKKRDFMAVVTRFHTNVQTKPQKVA